MNKIQKAGALIIESEKIMIVKPYGKPYFINPGGKYEEGEDAEECLRRELKEELMVELVSCKYFNTYNLDKAAHSNKPLSLELYLVNISGQAKPSSEIEMIEWMSKEDFEAKKFNVAPSFYKYVPDLIKDGVL